MIRLSNRMKCCQTVGERFQQSLVHWKKKKKGERSNSFPLKNKPTYSMIYRRTIKIFLIWEIIYSDLSYGQIQKIKWKIFQNWIIMISDGEKFILFCIFSLNSIFIFSLSLRSIKLKINTLILITILVFRIEVHEIKIMKKAIFLFVFLN